MPRIRIKESSVCAICHIHHRSSLDVQRQCDNCLQCLSCLGSERPACEDICTICYVKYFMGPAISAVQPLRM